MGNGTPVRNVIKWSARALFAAIIATLVYFSFFAQEGTRGQLNKIQRRFLKTEQRTAAELDKFAQGKRQFSPGQVLPVNQPAFFYRNDSLLCWNSNQLPVSSIADLHFPQPGVIQLQNGWYYVEMQRSGNCKYVVVAPLSASYPYQNAELENRLSPGLGGFKAELLPPGSGKFPLKNASGKVVAAVHFMTDSGGGVAGYWVVIGWIVVLGIIWQLLINRFSGKPLWQFGVWLLFAGFGFWLTKSYSAENSVLFDPSVLALSAFLPNLFSVIAGVLLFVGLMAVVTRNAGQSVYSKILLSLAVIATAIILQLLVRATIISSAIPMELEKLFSLNLLSVLLLLLYAILGFSGFQALRRLVHLEKRRLFPLLILIPLFLLSWALHFSLLHILVLSVLIALVLYERKPRFSNSLIYLLLVALWTSLSVIHYSQTKEMEDRELYANQLAEERDPSVDLEFIGAKQRLLNEPVAKRVILAAKPLSPDELKDVLERRIFNGFWEKYDIDFFVFGDSLDINSAEKRTFNELNQLLAFHGEQSEIDSNIYYIRDYTSQYSYVFRLPVKEKWLFGTLKSKKIPEEIGFPRLLISDRANVFESLKNYSIAKFYRGKLISEYGRFPYPTSLKAFLRNRTGKEIRFSRGGFTHLVLNKTSQDAIVLSAEKTDVIDKLTAIAFLLCFFGILALISSVPELRTASLRNVSFAVKIQLTLVGMVFLALVVFTIASSAFVQRQYFQYTADQISEKIHSVNTVARFRLGGLDSISQPLRSGDLASHLKNWSHIFVTDVNIYNLNGHLIRSSQPKIYNYGLIGEQMNPDAAHALLVDQQSEFVHSEHIGKLDYLSAYAPLFNDRGKLLAYINLQHFDQQNAFETQILRLLSAIINVFLILLVISLLVTFAASSWITLPLRVIRARLGEMQIGKLNRPIEIIGNDEIGQLVREYNAKLVELELAAEKLAVSERESAWREMAKQVAHEIKNPLTPMKLSLQQLLRVLDPDDPESTERVKRVAGSLLEQIDTLAAIANSFSSFASLPEPKNETVDLCMLLKNLVTLFDGTSTKIVASLPDTPVFVYGDADMLGRVFLNLLKNAEQAIQSAGKGDISVSINVTSGFVRVSIADTGSGIPEELRPRIFEPYFTTKTSGTGLGLALVKQIAESHGGSLKLLPGYPTTFEVSLPLLNV